MAKTEVTMTGPENLVGFMLWQVNNLWYRKLHRLLTPIGLTYVQFLTLDAIDRLTSLHKSVNQSELAMYTGCHKMMISKVLRNLEDKQAVVRENSKEDRRIVLLKITKKGKQILEKGRPIIEGMDKDFFEAIETIEVDALRGNFIKLLVANQLYE